MSFATKNVRQNVNMHSQSQDFRSFAIESTERVIKISRSVQLGHSRNDKEVSQFCGTLSSVLWSIKSYLQKSDQSQDEGQKKVESLLNNLERLCSWPRSLAKSDTKKSRNRWPTLSALRYPSNIDKATECLRNFASAGDSATQRSRVELLKKFMNFSNKVMKNEITHSVATQPRDSFPSPQRLNYQGMCFDLDHDIKHLYCILRQYRSCEREGSQRNIATYVRLNGFRSLVADDTTAEFGVLFLDHPHMGECHWQEACIQMNQTQPPNAPKVRFLGDDDGEQQLPCQPHISHTPISCATFCTHISGRSQAQLLLSAQNGKFLFQKYRNISRNWISSQQAVPLATLLSEARFTEKMKAVLALLLAKTTAQFYDSELIGQGFTKENVRFLFEERDRIQGVYVNEPMLVLDFPEEGIEAQGRLIPSAMIHDTPKILSLGLLLLELETRTPMESYREDPDLCPPGPVNMNTDYRIAERLLDPDHPAYILQEMDRLSPFRTVLPLCIKPGELARVMQENLSAQKKMNKTLDSSNVLRSVIYSEIVLPLEKWVSNYDKPDRVNVLYKAAQTRPATIPRTIRTSQHIANEMNTTAVTIRGNTSLEDRTRRLSQKWFENYDRLKDVLQPEDGETGAGYKPVKIAVLDTGINPDDYAYYHELGIIKHYKDYIDTNGNDPNDESGHGSMAVSLLVKILPNAILYVARVLRTNNPTRSEVENVVNAIQWATSQRVDIITMALGFKERQPQIAKAISRARSEEILIFSAASNSQNLDRIYYPAKDHHQVFGIFSTNAGNRESRDFNPSPDDRQYSLAIFGEGVEVAEDKPLLYGTSYSTSIAAGLAGMLLDFSRQETDQSGIPDISQVKDMNVMMKVFLEMATESSDGAYKCIRPWDLLKASNDIKRIQQREWIRGTIERLLNKI